MLSVCMRGRIGLFGLHKNVCTHLWPFQGRGNLGVVFHMLYIINIAFKFSSLT